MEETSLFDLAIYKNIITKSEFLCYQIIIKRQKIHIKLFFLASADIQPPPPLLTQRLARQPEPPDKTIPGIGNIQDAIAGISDSHRVI
jgi:hypothetical protein